MKRLLILLPLGYLWFCLINNLQVEWSTNPQYAYGWVVPLLCLGLLLRRWQSFPAARPPSYHLPSATPLPSDLRFCRPSSERQRLAPP